jgi:hypothetical protein
MRDRKQCLHAGFSPEHLIFFLLHAMQASGSLFLSLPALVFISAHVGGWSFFPFSAGAVFFLLALPLAAPPLLLNACLSAEDAISDASARISMLELLLTSSAGKPIIFPCASSGGSTTPPFMGTKPLPADVFVSDRW